MAIYPSHHFLKPSAYGIRRQFLPSRFSTRLSSMGPEFGKIRFAAK
jgi:hypothetical protein